MENSIRKMNWWSFIAQLIATIACGISGVSIFQEENLMEEITEVFSPEIIVLGAFYIGILVGSILLTVYFFLKIKKIFLYANVCLAIAFFAQLLEMAVYGSISTSLLAFIVEVRIIQGIRKNEFSSKDDLIIWINCIIQTFLVGIHILASMVGYFDPYAYSFDMLIELYNVTLFITHILVTIEVTVGREELMALKEENKVLVVRDEMSRQNYDEMSELLEHNFELMHDMKNHFLILDEYARLEDMKSIKKYVSSFKQEYISVERRIWTGNHILDMLLNRKKGEAEQKGIEFAIHSTTLNNIMLDESDICALFGNLFDNAIEASEKIKDGERWIKVKIEQKKNILFIEIKNRFKVLPTIINGELVTSKPDKIAHGYGVKSVKRIVKKYGGVYSFQVDEDVFISKVTFFDIKKS